MRFVPKPLQRAFVGLVLAVTAAAAGEEPPKLRPAELLVFVAAGDPTCAVQIFDTASRRTRSVLTPASCPKRLAVLHDRSSVVLVDDESIQEVEVRTNRIHARRTIPAPEPPRSGSYHPDRVEYLADGSLSVVVLNLTKKNGRDASQALRFVDRAGAWKLEESSAWCLEEGDSGCLDTLAPARPRRKGVDYVGDETRAWHERQLANLFVTRRESSTTGAGTEDVRSTIDLTLGFGERRSILRIRTLLGGDSGMIVVTTGVELELDGEKPMVLDDGQCETDLMGRYLLLHRFSDYLIDLIDLETGASPIGRLALAEWLY